MARSGTVSHRSGNASCAPHSDNTLRCIVQREGRAGAAGVGTVPTGREQNGVEVTLRFVVSPFEHTVVRALCVSVSPQLHCKMCEYVCACVHS